VRTPARPTMRSTQRLSMCPFPPRVPMVDGPFPPRRHRWPTSRCARRPRKSRWEGPRLRRSRPDAPHRSLLPARTPTRERHRFERPTWFEPSCISSSHRRAWHDGHARPRWLRFSGRASSRALVPLADRADRLHPRPPHRRGRAHETKPPTRSGGARRLVRRLPSR